MKIACFWAEDRSLDRISFRHEHLVTGFRELGHEAELVTARPLAGRYSGPARFVESLDELARPATWLRGDFDLAVGITWLRKAPVLGAIAEAGIPRVAIADSDGLLGYGAHPRAAWSHLRAGDDSVRGRLRAARYFLRRWRASRSRRDAEELAIVASARSSSSIAFTSDSSVASFRRFLATQRAPGSSAHDDLDELGERAFVAPFPVPREFATAAIPEKSDRVVAIGRWSDPQKDAPLLSRTLQRLLANRAETSVEIFGADGRAALGEIAARSPRLAIRGVQEPEVVRVALASARVLLLTSRWETGPHVAGEALALGATLAAPPLPTVEGLVEAGRFGAIARDRSPHALAGAVVEELERWDRGERDAAANAAIWRERLSDSAYCAALLASVGAA